MSKQPAPVPKNVITPHKGGRSEVWPGFRITPEDKERLAATLAARGLSFADWVAEQLQQENEQ